MEAHPRTVWFEGVNEDEPGRASLVIGSVNAVYRRVSDRLLRLRLYVPFQDVEEAVLKGQVLRGTDIPHILDQGFLFYGRNPPVTPPLVGEGWSQLLVEFAVNGPLAPRCAPCTYATGRPAFRDANRQ